MNYSKAIVCLAFSRKHAGRCVAGIVYPLGKEREWVRPVGAGEHGELSEKDCQLRCGRQLSVLDIVSIPLIRPLPKQCQRENHLVDTAQSWERHGVLDWEYLQSLVEELPDGLWLSGSVKLDGPNDRIPVGASEGFGHSLVLIAPKGLEILVSKEGEVFGELSIRAKFEYGGVNYTLKVTDPEVEGYYARKPDGRYPVEHALMCVSLSEPFAGYRYKLVASIMTSKRSAGRS